jgi:hypothetical protein
MKISKKFIFESLEESIEEQIDELRLSPEMQSLDTFINYKLDNEELSYNWIELQALSRNLTAQNAKFNKDYSDAVSAASPYIIHTVRKTLEEEMGFEFIPREKMKDVRGFSSNPHGSNRWVGNHGGSGFIDHVGAMGGKYNWSSSDSKNLSMGAKKK